MNDAIWYLPASLLRNFKSPMTKEAYDQAIKRLRENGRTHDFAPIIWEGHYHVPGDDRDWMCKRCGIICRNERQQPELVRYSCKEWTMREALE